MHRMSFMMWVWLHFRMKMDAVPGIPTTIWFTPKYTTAEMKKITGNKDFVYEISCDQMCGTGHYSMKGLVIVETQEEYNTWLAGKKPQYVTLQEQKRCSCNSSSPGCRYSQCQTDRTVI